MNEPDRDWRVKYRELVSESMIKEQRATKLEGVLRLLIGRLCLAGQGRDPRLDEELARLASAVRKGTDSELLEELVAPLSQAVAILDAAAPVDLCATARTATARSASAPAAAAVPQTLAGESSQAHDPPAVVLGEALPETVALSLLDKLALLPELQDSVEELRARGEGPLAPNDLVNLLTRLARLASEQRTQVQRERLELEDMVQQTTARLDEIEAHLTGELAERDKSRSDTTRLNVLVTDEVEQLRAGAQQANDLAELRGELDSRLNNIATHVQEFQAREESRSTVYRERTQRMRTRIAALERESRSLQQNLKAEQRQAMIDALTGVPNRAAYDDRLAQEIKRWKRFGRAVTLLTWDIDGFKTINDSFGHKAGDKVLRIVGQQLVRHVRDTDFVARYGGDEFAMLLVGSDASMACEVAEKIRAEIASLGFHFHDRPVQVTMSCGITSFAGAETVESVFERADQALYQAKREGRNRCTVV